MAPTSSAPAPRAARGVFFLSACRYIPLAISSGYRYKDLHGNALLETQMARISNSQIAHETGRVTAEIVTGEGSAWLIIYADDKRAVSIFPENAAALAHLRAIAAAINAVPVEASVEEVA